VAENSLAETLTISPGLGEAYVPTAIGPDGTVYTLNGGTLFALGAATNFGMRVLSSAPDSRATVVGQALRFTAVVTNINPLGPVPSGTVTFQDITYRGGMRVTNLLAASLPLTNGSAVVTNSSLAAGTNYLGNHFITAIYSGDANFPGTTATMVQKVHAVGTITTLTSAPRDAWGAVNLTAAVTPDPAGPGTPSGLVSF